jgi:monoamine oxidase
MYTLKRIAYLCSIIILIMTGICHAAINKSCVLNSNTTSKNAEPVIIVGAGLTGLISAYELKKAGIPAIILEATNRIGGRVNTIHFPDNATAEAHMEEYWLRTPNYTLLKELKLPLIASCADASVIIDGKILAHNGKCGKEYLAGIFNLTEVSAFKKWNDKTASIYNQLHDVVIHNQPLPPNLEAFTKISFAEYVKRANLPRKVQEMIRVTLEPEISIEWDQISALDGIDEVRIFLESPAGYGETNFHVEGGNENYINALADQLPKGSIKTRARVTKISQNADAVTVTYVDEAQKEHTIQAPYAIVTVPLFALDKITFIPDLPAEKKQAITTTRFASYVKIQYRVKRAAEKLWSSYGKDGLFTLLTDSAVGSIYNATDFEKQLSKSDDFIITLLINGQYAKDLAHSSPEETLKAVTARMDKLFPGFSQYVTSAQAYIYPTAIAYWPISLERSRFDALAIALRKPFGRIQIGGDTTEDSHSEGAAQAAMRMSSVLIKLMCY